VQIAFSHGITSLPHTLKMTMNGITISLPMVKCSALQHFPFFSTFFFSQHFSFHLFSPSMIIYICFLFLCYYLQFLYCIIHTQFFVSSKALEKHTTSCNKWKQPTIITFVFFPPTSRPTYLFFGLPAIF
jgi:hypothetical protein